MNIGSQIANMCSVVYGQVAQFITPLAIICFVVCLVGMLVSNNQKTVERFTSWRNRILITWVLFMSLGTLSTAVTELLNSGGFEGLEISE